MFHVKYFYAGVIPKQHNRRFQAAVEESSMKRSLSCSGLFDEAD